MAVRRIPMAPKQDFRFVFLASLLEFAVAAPAGAQVTSRLGVATDGTVAEWSNGYPKMTPDARFVVFSSRSRNLVPGDTNWASDVFLRDRLLGTTERVSLSDGGAEGSLESLVGVPTADGRCVAIISASPLVVGDTNGKYDVFVRDRQSATTELVSVASNGVQSDTDTYGYLAISADGRYVAFTSAATNLVPGDTNGTWDVYVRDRQNGTTEVVDVTTGGRPGNAGAFQQSISPDGRYVAFFSPSTNLVAGDTNAAPDVFLRDRQTGATELVSLASSGAQGDDRCEYDTGISADGRLVAFESRATNLVAGDTNGRLDVFIRDRTNGTTERVSVGTGGEQANRDCWLTDLSPDGRYVVFESEASTLVTGDTNQWTDVFVHDRATGVTERASLAWDGKQGNEVSLDGGISADGRFVVFSSGSWNLVPKDEMDGEVEPHEVFLRDRAHPAYASSCDPGASGVMSCPCANPPSGPGRGCDNSAATGGAARAVTGGEYLSSDTLVFTTTGEKPTALSVLLQGTTSPVNGLEYGQGVRCVGGTLKRLFTRAASGGSITAPDFDDWEPSVHERSAARGDPIAPGTTRWYLVFYRDPIVLGGCPATNTINCTQTLAVAWKP